MIRRAAVLLAILAGAIGNLRPTRALLAKLARWISPFSDDPGIATLIQIINSNWKYQSVLLSIEGDAADDSKAEESLKGVLAELERRRAEGKESASYRYSA